MLMLSARRRHENKTLATQSGAKLMTSEIARHTDWHRLKTQTIGAFHIFPLCHIDLHPQVAASFKAMKRHNEIRKRLGKQI
jgi:hypothetical protein